MPNAPVASMREKARKVAPKLIDLTEKVLFGDVWERPGLSKRDRSLITVAALMSTYRPEQLRPHLQRALDNGVTRTHHYHLAFYSGWPTAMTAAGIANDVFERQSGFTAVAARLGTAVFVPHVKQGQTCDVTLLTELRL